MSGNGASYIEPDLNVAMITPDDRSLEWWTDFEKTFESFAAFSRKDAETLRRWHDEFAPIVELILIPEAQSPPLDPQKRTELLSRSVLGGRLLEVSTLSSLEFVRREFEHPAVQAGLLFFNGLQEVYLRQPGFGHSIPSLIADLREHGGEVMLNAEPRSILMRGDYAIDVELKADGRCRRRSPKRNTNTSASTRNRTA